MSLRSAVSLFKLGKSNLWQNGDYSSSKIGGYKNLSTFNNPLFFYYLSQYYKNIVYSVSLKPSSVLTQFGEVMAVDIKAKEDSDLVKTVILLGNIWVNSGLNSVSVFISYYFDTRVFSPVWLKSFNYKFHYSSNLISKKLGFSVKVNHFNHFLYNLKNVFKFKLDFNNRFLLKKKYKFLRFNSLFSKFKLTSYLYCVKSFYGYKKNTYFFRILDPLFSIFTSKNPDWNIVINALAFEFKNLRKKHKQFLNFFFKLFLKLFNLFKSNLSIEGFRWLFKGRMVPYNREHPRSIKKVLQYGLISKNNTLSHSKDYFNKTLSRFGSISIYFIIYKKPFRNKKSYNVFIHKKTPLSHFFFYGSYQNLIRLNFKPILYFLSFFKKAKKRKFKVIKNFLHNNIKSLTTIPFNTKYFYNSTLIIYLMNIFFKILKKKSYKLFSNIYYIKQTPIIYKIILTRIKKLLNLFFIFYYYCFYWYKFFSTINFFVLYSLIQYGYSIYNFLPYNNLSLVLNIYSINSFFYIRK